MLQNKWINIFLREEKVLKKNSPHNEKLFKNKKYLTENNAYDPSLEHEACGVGLIATTDGKKSRKVVDYGIEALKAVWHRGAVDADGKSGDGAGIKLEISPEFFVQKILETGHKHEQDKRICVGMVFDALFRMIMLTKKM